MTGIHFMNKISELIVKLCEELLIDRAEPDFCFSCTLMIEEA